jgi:carotenoid cleavage dioxygenase-like enzyme
MTMSNPIQKAPFIQGLTTLEQEVVLNNLPVQGTMPTWLQGSLVRNGPAKFEVGTQKYRHWFDGLGMLHRFAFQEGKVRYANKFLQSPDYREAQEQGRITHAGFATDPCRSIFGRFFNLFSPDPGSQNGNVNLTQVADAYLAMTETPLPIQFDPQTLATVGIFTYGGDNMAGQITTAHPHYDVGQQQLINYIIEMGRKCYYHVYAIPQGGYKRQRLASIPVSEPAYMHSFGMTENWVILAEFPLVVNPLRLALRTKPYIENYRWEAQRGVNFILVNKRDGSVKRWHADAFFAFHHINAFEEQEDVLVDICALPDHSTITAFYLDQMRAGNPIPPAQFRRYRLAAGNSNADYEVMSNESIELLRTNYAQINGRDYRYAYGASTRADRPGDFHNQLVKVDVQARTTQVWLQEDCYVGEPVFVAAPSSATGGGPAEDAGVVLSVVLHAAQGTSFLLALDAQSFAEIARAEVPHHIPFGFHGQFFGE